MSDSERIRLRESLRPDSLNTVFRSRHFVSDVTIIELTKAPKRADLAYKDSKFQRVNEAPWLENGR